LIETIQEVFHIFLEHDQGVTLEIRPSILLALHNVQENISVPIFFYIKEIGPLPRGSARRKNLTPGSHTHLPDSREILKIVIAHSPPFFNHLMLLPFFWYSAAIRARRIMVITPAFQAGDTGSIPAGRYFQLKAKPVSGIR
jgi:hypothetical protein